MNDQPEYAVWYASVGCLPDADGPEFVGTLTACEEYVAEQEEEREQDENRSVHDLYEWTIDAYDVEGDES